MSETEGNKIRKEVLQALRRLSDQNPQLRICQLIGNVLPAFSDFYYIEDSELLEHLNHFENNRQKLSGEK